MSSRETDNSGTVKIEEEEEEEEEEEDESVVSILVTYRVQSREDLWSHVHLFCCKRGGTVVQSRQLR